MGKLIFCFLFLLLSLVTNAQINTDSIQKKEIAIEENDTVLGDPIQLEEVIVYRQKLSAEEKKQFLLLQNRVYRVYPFAKIAADRLTLLNRNMEKMKTGKEKRKYFKIVEDYMENEFTSQLKKLSRKQGQILVKLIHRQTGITTYDLIKDYKSGWKAFWSNNTARLFDISLKAKYLPYEVNEDFLIETILDRAFNRGRLAPQTAATPIDIYELTDFWQKKAISLKQ
jgi:mannose/fructose/N-acetylgalactosamine-specific phosphotransferase system component IIB